MLNNVLDKFRSTINNASDNLSATVQNIAETNRNKKKLSLLKMMMKSEIKQMDRVYTELGKEYYKLLKKSGKKPTDKKQQDLLKNLDDSMAKITYARDCYRAIMESESKASGEDTAEQSAPIEEAEKAVPVAEEKPVSAAPVVEEKPVTTAPVVEEKPVSAPESKVDGLRGIAAVGVAGIAKETVQSAAVVTEKKMPIADEKKAVSTADTADGKVKKVSKDLETLKRDNRRLREVLMKIAKTMMAVGSADNDKENPDDAS